MAVCIYVIQRTTILLLTGAIFFYKIHNELTGMSVRAVEKPFRHGAKRIVIR